MFSDFELLFLFVFLGLSAAFVRNGLTGKAKTEVSNPGPYEDRRPVARKGVTAKLDQPWKAWLAAEMKDGTDVMRPWVNWRPSVDDPSDKPWLYWGRGMTRDGGKFGPRETTPPPRPEMMGTYPVVDLARLG